MKKYQEFPNYKEWVDQVFSDTKTKKEMNPQQLIQAYIDEKTNYESIIKDSETNKLK